MTIDFDAFYQQNERAVRYRLSFLLPPDEVEDAAQRVWMRVWQALPRVRHTGNLRGWLSRITTNVGHDIIRARGYRMGHHAQASLEAESPSTLARAEADPGVFIPERLELQQELRETWRRAAPADRTIIVGLLADGALPVRKADLYAARKHLKQIRNRVRARNVAVGA